MHINRFPQRFSLFVSTLGGIGWKINFTTVKPAEREINPPWVSSRGRRVIHVWAKMLSYTNRGRCLTLRAASAIPKSLATFAQQPQSGFCYSRDMRFTLGRDFVFQKVLDPRCLPQENKSIRNHISGITCFYAEYLIRY
jgi:hypothetical protein